MTPPPEGVPMVLVSQAPTPPVRWTAPEGVWTEPDLHLFPQDGHRYEIVDGSLHVAPPAPRWHDDLVGAVVTTLRSPAPPGWRGCDPPARRGGVRPARPRHRRGHRRPQQPGARRDRAAAALVRRDLERPGRRGAG